MTHIIDISDADHDTVAMENAVAEMIGGEVSYGNGLVSYLAMENRVEIQLTKIKNHPKILI